MPFKSKAQRRKFAQLLVEGKISDEVYEEWNRSTGRKGLPERLHPQTAKSRKSDDARRARQKRSVRKAGRRRSARAATATKSAARKRRQR